jgi:SAM-dependent methyltransferase
MTPEPVPPADAVRELYSDGDQVEEDILTVVREGRDITDVLVRDRRWPVLYHLSPERRNLLEWFPFAPGASLLELGAGCGALTGLFCERLGRVVAVELSERRSAIIRARFGGLSNLTVLAGNLMEAPLAGAFDYVTVIGVLEYARAFIPGPDPYGAFLNLAARHLAPDGTLILALENKFGLKYFAGAREDHTGRPFESLEGYPHPDPVETFSRPEIADLLARHGFPVQTFYYPHPDYKLPVEIFSDDYLPGVHAKLDASLNLDQDRFRCFDEKLAMANVVRSRAFPFFANSFLIAARRDQVP